MDNELIYWRHHTPVGIKVEEISGGNSYSQKLWISLARQLYCENGKGEFRDLCHYPNGAPFIAGEMNRISISHTDHFMVVATLPKTPEINLAQLAERVALGIDAEKWNRNQVLAVRSKFLTPEELEMIPSDDLRANILAWTAKEALYKAALTPEINFQSDLMIESLPTVNNPLNDSDKEQVELGRAWLKLPDGTRIKMNLYTYDSEGCCVTLAFSPRCAKFH